jgi:hypothetical protein
VVQCREGIHENLNLSGASGNSTVLSIKEVLVAGEFLPAAAAFPWSTQPQAMTSAVTARRKRVTH